MEGEGLIDLGWEDGVLLKVLKRKKKVKITANNEIEFTSNYKASLQDAFYNLTLKGDVIQLTRLTLKEYERMHAIQSKGLRRALPTNSFYLTYLLVPDYLSSLG